MEEKSFYAKSREEWRTWLKQNHSREKAVMLVVPHKDSSMKGIYYETAVLEALCFGWIDGKANKWDSESYQLLFTPRTPKSYWSKVNKRHIAELFEQGLMEPAGIKMVELAKKTGTWNALDEIDNEVIPDDLQKHFDQNPIAFENYMNFAPSSRKMILQWIMDAKQAATRERRITETVGLASQNIKAHHPKK